MSVWKQPCYRDDAFQAVVKHLHDTHLNIPVILDLLDFEVEEFGEFPVPSGLKPGNVKAQVEDGYLDAAKLRGSPGLANPISDDAACDTAITIEELDRYYDGQDEWFAEREELATRFSTQQIPREPLRSRNLNTRKAPEEVCEPFVKLLRTIGDVRFGIHGVYQFVSESYPRIQEEYGAPTSDRWGSTLRGHIKAGLACSYYSPGCADEYARKSDQALRGSDVPAGNFVRRLVRAATFSGSKTAKTAREDAEADNEALHENPPDASLFGYLTYSIYNLLILMDDMRDITYIFTKNDIIRIERIIEGLSYFPTYCYSYAWGQFQGNTKMEASANRLVKLMLEKMGECTKDSANYFCRYWDIIFNMKLAHEAQDVTTTAYQLQIDKYRKTPGSALINPDQVFVVVGDHLLKEQFELLNLYKVLPAPDFDYFSMAYKQQEIYKKKPTNKFGVETPNTGTFEEAKQYQKLGLIRMYYKKHGVCPGQVKDTHRDEDKDWQQAYPYVAPVAIPFSDIEDIDFEGSFEYYSSGEDYINLCNDKAICPEDVDLVTRSGDMGHVPLETRNQLLDVLTRKEKIDTNILSNMRDRLNYDVKIDDKPEAKKPNGRWFMEAPTEARLLQSEYEANIHRYAKHAPGFMSGKNVTETIKLENHIYEPRYEASETVPLFISFDLEKWSPWMDRRVHEFCDELWAYAFGKPDLQGAGQIFTEGRMHYIKGPIHPILDKPGTDFEGFAGKKLTNNGTVSEASTKFKHQSIPATEGARIKYHIT